MNRMFFLIILLLIFAGLEFICFRSLTRVIPETWKWVGVVVYWTSTLFAYGIIVYSMMNYPEFQAKRDYSMAYFAFGMFVIMFIPKLFIALFYAVDWGVLKISPPPTDQSGRRRFIALLGWFIASIPFMTIFWGMWKGKYDFRIEEVSIPGLSKAQKRIRIIQISDAHLGSFPHDAPIPAFIDKINALKPDVVVFTGDLVNNYASEAEYWIPHFQRINAPLGKFSTLGNHDYGDYGQFESQQEKKANLEQLKDIHRQMGFDLLLNDKRQIQWEDQLFELIGIENWGLPPFPQYGDLNKACGQLSSDSVKILLSHDPSHWDAEVLEKMPIQVALAGHTHGMQFGLRIFGWQWSPVKYKYPRWAGLYQEKDQYLYVNRGFGYLGFPGRVGMPPEITLLEI